MPEVYIPITSDMLNKNSKKIRYNIKVYFIFTPVIDYCVMWIIYT